MGRAYEIKNNDSINVTGKIYEVGMFSLLIPDGWLENPFYVVGDTSQTPMNSIVSVYKGAPSQESIYSYPGVTVKILKTGSTPITPNKSMYSNPLDIKPITINGVEWIGFISDNGGYPFIEIVAECGEFSYIVMIGTDRINGKISINDKEVQAIIASITPTPID